MSLKTRKRIIALAAASLLTGTALAGCSTSSDSASSDTLTIGTNHSPAVKAVVAEFKKDNPGVTVTVKDMAQNYREVLGTQLAGGNAPDLMEVPGGGGNNISAKVAGKKGYYADLSTAGWSSGVADTAREQLSTDDGKLVAVPMVLSSIGGIYNQGVINQIGLTVPKTWTQVLTFCADAKAAGKVAYGLGLSDTWTTQLIPYALTSTLVYGKDAKFLDEQVAGTATFADSAWKQAFDQYVQMRDAGCFNDSPNGTPNTAVEDAIRTGNTLATVSVASETAAIATGGPADLKLSYTAFPATDNPDETNLPISSAGFAVNAKSSHADLARKFIDYLATPQAQLAYATGYGDAPAMPGDQAPTDQISTVVDEFVKKDQLTTWPDRLWPSTTVQPAVFDGVQAIFSGDATVDDVLTKMDTAFKQG